MQGQQAVENRKRNRLLDMQIDNAPAEQQRRNKLLDLQAEGQQQNIDAGKFELENARYKQEVQQSIAGLGYIIDSQNPKAEAERRYPNELAELRKQIPDLDSYSDDEFRQIATEMRNQLSAKAGIGPAPKPKQFTTEPGPRGSVIQIDPVTGERKAVVGPDNTEARAETKPYFRQMSKQEIEAQGLPPGTVARVDDRTGDVRILSKPVDAGEKITDGQRRTNGYLTRMEAVEPKVGDYIPTTAEYSAFNKIMRNTGGFFSSATAGELNKQLSPKARQYFQAVSDWSRAKLRNESGAVIGADEMLAEVSTYFPLPGDDPDTIAQKVAGRATAVQSLREAAGPAAVKSDDRRKSGAPAAIAEGSIARNPSTGQRIQYRNGQWVPLAQ